MKIQMYCIFARESVVKMNGNKGKMCTQAGHAYLHTYWDSERRFRSYHGGLGGDIISDAEAYVDAERAYKITCIVDTVAELEALRDKYHPICGVSLVKDAGLTVFAEPTITCLGIGPIRENEIGDDLKSLKLFLK